MNTQDDIMKALWDNENAQGIAKMVEEIVMPAISKMTEDQQIEAMGTVRDAVSDIAEYEECRHHMTDTIIEAMKTVRNMTETIEEMRETIKNMLPPWEASNKNILPPLEDLLK